MTISDFGCLFKICIQGRVSVALDLALLEYELRRQPRRSVSAITISESASGA